MTTFQGNDTLALMGEEWNRKIREFSSTVDSPEAAMLAERLEAGLSGEVEDRLTAVVLAQAIEALPERLGQRSLEPDAEK